MSDCFLDHHDDPATRAEENYSRYVADDLSHAYRAITRQDRRTALQHLEFAEGASMSRRQSIRLHYLLGMCLLEERALLRARDHLARALGQLEELGEDELAALARVAFLAAEVESNMEEFGRAADFSAIAQEALRRLRAQAGAAPDPTDLALEIDVLLEASKQTFYVEQYEDSVRLLEEARSLLVPAMDRRSRSETELKQRGTIEWVAATQDRWRGEPWPALGHAMAASRIHELLGEPRNQGRILTVVADIVLDLLEYDLASAPKPDRETLLALARLNAERAIGLCRSDDDPIGSELACLAKMRYLRVRKDTTDRIPTIEAVMRKAEEHHDRMLLAQAMTALGFEASARGDDEGALDYHRQAVALLENTDTKAMAVWSRRELRRIRELKP
jgi:tetratricopeptide (TPR) repeat protein